MMVLSYESNDVFGSLLDCALGISPSTFLFRRKATSMRIDRALGQGRRTEKQEHRQSSTARYP